MKLKFFYLTFYFLLSSTAIIYSQGATLDGNYSNRDSTTVYKNKYFGILNFAGLGLGINFLFDNNFNTSMPDEYKYLDLNHTKSTSLNLNLIECGYWSFNKKIQILTGLSFNFNNYRFQNENYFMASDSSVIYAYKDPSMKVTKSKLTTTYLIVPLIFEHYTHHSPKQCRNCSRKGFFIRAGLYGGILIGSKTKHIYEEDNKRKKIKNRNDLHLNPLIYGLTARVGWGQFCLYMNYNLSTLFEKNKGPELYPFEVGILLRYSTRFN